MPENNDPLSNLGGNIMLKGTLLFVGGLLVWFLMENLNLALGLQSEVSATVESIQIHNGSRSNSYTVSFKTEDGSLLDGDLSGHQKSKLQIAKGDTVALRTDGLLWTQIVAADSGKGFVELR